MTANPLFNVTGWAEKSNAAIAAETGLPIKRISQYRYRRKLPTGPRSPGSGKYDRTGRPMKALTMRARVKRLEAVWAFLWSEDPGNALQRDEVAAIKQRTCCAQLP